MKKEKTWKCCYEKLLNTEFAWDRNSLSQADTITRIPFSIYKRLVRELISKINNGKAAVLSGVVSEMLSARNSESDYGRQKELKQQ